MFYGSVYQTIMLIVTIVLLGFTLVFYGYGAKKATEYGNDERWQFIQNKANKVAGRYYELLVVVTSLGLLITLFYDLTVTLSLERLLRYAFYILSIRNIVEFFALRHFDKVL